MEKLKIIKLSNKNRQYANEIIINNWASTDIVIRGEVVDATKVEGFFAYDNNEIAGLITYKMYGDVCEMVTLNSLNENKGVGTTLCNKLKDFAIKNKCKAIRLITTNDNLKALGFYQKRGFVLNRLFPNAMENVRKMKNIPLIGDNNIPLRDEIELILSLT